jgi:hypothetical protein
MWAKLERLDELLRQEPAQAKAEIAKHLDGEFDRACAAPFATPAWCVVDLRALLAPERLSYVQQAPVRAPNQLNSMVALSIGIAR